MVTKKTKTIEKESNKVDEKKLIEKLSNLIIKKKSINITQIPKLLKIDEKKSEKLIMKLSDDFILEKSKKRTLIKYVPKSDSKEIVKRLNDISEIMTDYSEFFDKNIEKIIPHTIKSIQAKHSKFNDLRVKKLLKQIEILVNEYGDKYSELKLLRKKINNMSMDIKKDSIKLNDKIKSLNKESKSLTKMNKILDKKKIQYVKKIMQISGLIGKEIKKKTKSVKKTSKKTIIEELGIKMISNNYSKPLPEVKIKQTKKGEVIAEPKEDIKEELKEKTIKEKKGLYESGIFSTEIDELLKLVKEEGKISFKKLSKLYDEKISTIESWCESLEEKGYITINYPLIGSPYIKYIKNTKKEEKNE